MKPLQINDIFEWWKVWMRDKPGCHCPSMTSGLTDSYHWAYCPTHNPEGKAEGWIQIIKLDPTLTMAGESRKAARTYQEILSKEFP